MHPKIFKGRDTTRLPSLKTINELAMLYETDKSFCLDEQLSWHKDFPLNHALCYMKPYDVLLSAFRASPITILEIGVIGALAPFSSMNVWLDFFHNGTIFGMDNCGTNNLDDLKPHRKAIEKILDKGGNFLWCDQGDEEALIELTKTLPPCTSGRGFDVIIDDGSHNSSDIWTSLGVLWPFLTPGGFYFIEDVTSAPQYPASVVLGRGDSSEVWHRFARQDISTDPSSEKGKHAMEVCGRDMQVRIRCQAADLANHLIGLEKKS